jgi:hypothetical protein
MYFSIANHLGLHSSEPIYKTLVGPSTCSPRSASVNGCSVPRGAQAVGIGPHLSHLIYIYKSKITKYMYMVQCPIHRNRKVVIHHQGSYESHFPRKFMGPGALSRLTPLSRPEIGQIHLMS